MESATYTSGVDLNLHEGVHLNHVVMGDRVKIRSGSIVFGTAERPLEMGSDIFIGPRCYLQGGAEKVKIGNRVTMAVGVAIHSDSGPNTSPLLQKHYPITAAPVMIEDDVWIGDYAVILPGVTIGKGSVVGAHAVVKSNVPPNSVVVGQPARVVKTLS